MNASIFHSSNDDLLFEKAQMQNMYRKDDRSSSAEQIDDDNIIFFDWVKIKNDFIRQADLLNQYFLILVDQYPLDHLKRRPGFTYNDEASKVLYEACKDGHISVFEVIRLLEANADPNYVDLNDGAHTSLHWCARKGNFVNLKVLVFCGGDILFLDYRRRNTLMHACDTKRTDTDMVKFLLQQKHVKKNLEIRDSGNCTALLSAIFQENVWIVRELLLAGASVLEKGNFETSAYDAALWVYATGLMLDPTQVPKNMIEQNSKFYKYFSLKGSYNNEYFVGFQNLYKYNSELIFRMVHRKMKEEEKFFVPSRKDFLIIKAPVPDEKIRKNLMKKRKERKIRKLLELSDERGKQQLENWNLRRKGLANRIDNEFSKFLRGSNVDEPHEWVRLEKRKGMDWEMKLSQGKSIYSSPPVKGTLLTVKNITLDQKISDFFNRTHNENDRLDFKKKNDPIVQYANSLNLVKDENTSKNLWKIDPNNTRDPNGLGFYDVESRWHEIRQKTLLVAPESIDSDDDLSEYIDKSRRYQDDDSDNEKSTNRDNFSDISNEEERGDTIHNELKVEDI